MELFLAEGLATLATTRQRERYVESQVGRAVRLHMARRGAARFTVAADGSGVAADPGPAESGGPPAAAGSSPA